MSLPWEAEKIVNAFQRASSQFTNIHENSKPYIEGIQTTLSFLPLDLQIENLFM